MEEDIITDGLSQAIPQETQDIALGLWAQAQNFAMTLLRPWNAYQVGIAIGVFVLAALLAKVVAPRFHGWMRRREGWPKWRMRFLVMIHRRMRLILFVALIWPVVWGMQATTWPSRSYLLEVFASLALAWLLITVITRFIVNGFVRSLVRYAAWTWVTLSILGLTGEVERLLDSAAVSFGDMRLSVWMVIQAVVIVAALMFAARFVSKTTDAGSGRQVRAASALWRGVFHRVAGRWRGPDGACGAVGRDWCGPWVWPAKGGVEPCVGCDPFAGSVDQAR
jgi:hypothetical protein